MSVIIRQFFISLAASSRSVSRLAMAAVVVVVILAVALVSDNNRIAHADDHPDESDGFPIGTWVSVPSSTPGTIGQSDNDIFRFNGNSNSTYRVRLELGSLSRGLIRVYGGDGRFIGEEYDQFSWTATRDETFYIRISSGYAGDTGSYILRVSEDSPHSGPSDPSGPPTFRMTGNIPSPVEVGKPFTVQIQMSQVSGPGEHGGISVSFPSLTGSGASDNSYSSSIADVEAIRYTSGLSRVSFYDAGDTIYSSSGRQIRAKHLLVETDDSSWGTSSIRTLFLRVTPKRSDDFTIRIRGWICADGYSNCSRKPSSSGSTDQQGYRTFENIIKVTEGTSPAPQCAGSVLIDSLRASQQVFEPGANVNVVFRVKGANSSVSRIVTLVVEIKDSNNDTVYDSNTRGENLYAIVRGTQSVQRTFRWQTNDDQPDGKYQVLASVRNYQNFRDICDATWSGAWGGGHEKAYFRIAATQDDHGNDRATATAISTEASVFGDIERAGDVDFFSFQARAGKRYVIETSPGTLEDTVIWLWDSGGSQYIDRDNDDGEGLASKIEWVADRTGTYYVEVRGYRNSTGLYGLSVSEETDSTQQCDGSVLIDSLRASQQVFEPGANVNVVFRVKGANSSVSRTVTLVVEIKDSNGKTVYDSSTSRHNINVTVRGARYVQPTFRWQTNDDQPAGRYRILASVRNSEDFDDVCDSTWRSGGHGEASFSIATSISTNAYFSGNIERAGDADFFSFQARAGKRYVIETSPGTLEDTEIWLWDSGGSQRIRTDDDGGEDRASKIEWVADRTGTYYVEVRGYRNSTGLYWLSITEEDPSPTRVEWRDAQCSQVLTQAEYGDTVCIYVSSPDDSGNMVSVSVREVDFLLSDDPYDTFDVPVGVGGTGSVKIQAPWMFAPNQQVYPEFVIRLNDETDSERLEVAAAVLQLPNIEPRSLVNRLNLHAQLVSGSENEWKRADRLSDDPVRFVLAPGRYNLRFSVPGYLDILLDDVRVESYIEEIKASIRPVAGDANGDGVIDESDIKLISDDIGGNSFDYVGEQGTDIGDVALAAKGIGYPQNHSWIWVMPVPLQAVSGPTVAINDLYAIKLDESAKSYLTFKSNPNIILDDDRQLLYEGYEALVPIPGTETKLQVSESSDDDSQQEEDPLTGNFKLIKTANAIECPEQENICITADDGRLVLAISADESDNSSYYALGAILGDWGFNVECCGWNTIEYLAGWVLAGFIPVVGDILDLRDCAITEGHVLSDGADCLAVFSFVAGAGTPGNVAKVVKNTKKWIEKTQKVNGTDNFAAASNLIGKVKKGDNPLIKNASDLRRSNKETGVAFADLENAGLSPDAIFKLYDENIGDPVTINQWRKTLADNKKVDRFSKAWGEVTADHKNAPENLLSSVLNIEIDYNAARAKREIILEPGIGPTKSKILNPDNADPKADAYDVLTGTFVENKRFTRQGNADALNYDRFFDMVEGAEGYLNSSQFNAVRKLDGGKVILLLDARALENIHLNDKKTFTARYSPRIARETVAGWIKKIKDDQLKIIKDDYRGRPELKKMMEQHNDNWRKVDFVVLMPGHNNAVKIGETTKWGPELVTKTRDDLFKALVGSN